MCPLSYMCPRVNLSYYHWTWKIGSMKKCCAQPELWIMNEKPINFQKIVHTSILPIIYDQYIKFCLPTFSESTWFTICHHSWIINEEYVNFKKYFLTSISHVVFHLCNEFYPPNYFGSTWLTICHNSWIINERCVNFIKFKNWCQFSCKYQMFQRLLNILSILYIFHVYKKYGHQPTMVHLEK